MTIIDARARFIQPVDRKKLRLKFKRPTKYEWSTERDDEPPKEAP